MEDPELAFLLQRLEQSVANTSRRMRTISAVLIAGFGAAAALAALSQQWVGLGIAVVLGVVSAGMGVQAVKRARPDEMRPVLDAVRDAPERVDSVRHHPPRYAPSSHWLEIKTASHRLTVQADDWQRLYSALQKRCPRASFD